MNKYILKGQQDVQVRSNWFNYPCRATLEYDETTRQVKLLFWEYPYTSGATPVPNKWKVAFAADPPHWEHYQVWSESSRLMEHNQSINFVGPYISWAGECERIRLDKFDHASTLYISAWWVHRRYGYPGEKPGFYHESGMFELNQKSIELFAQMLEWAKGEQK